MRKKVAIVIVSWNGVSFLKDCLTSVYNQTYVDFGVYFVDNGSTDDSVAFVREHFPKTTIIQLNRNTGFSHANNIGIQEAFKDNAVEYIFTLNNDTVIDSECISELVECIELNRQTGSVSPKIKFLHEQTLIDSVGLCISTTGGGANKGYREEDLGQYNSQSEIFGVCAGAALYKKTALCDIVYQGQFFDDAFFAYYEDLDLAWRLRLKGWKSFYTPKALVYHVHSATGVMYSPFKAYHVNRNRFFLITKNFPIKHMFRAFLSMPKRYMELLRAMLFKKSGPSYELKKKTSIMMPFFLVVRGWLSFIIELPTLVIKRSKIQSEIKVTNVEIQSWFKKFAAIDDGYKS